MVSLEVSSMVATELSGDEAVEEKPAEEEFAAEGEVVREETVKG